MSPGCTAGGHTTIFRSFLLSLIVMLSIAALVSAASAYTNAEYGFSYDPPDGWTTDTSRSSGEIVSFKDPSSPAVIAITANTTSGAGLDEVVASSKADLVQQSQVPFTFISERAIEIDHRPGHELIYGASMLGIGIREKMDFVVDGGNVIVFFLTVPASGPGPEEALFDTSIGTVRFSRPASAPTSVQSTALPVPGTPILTSGQTESP
ncbi:MAG TPA: hypothetical protein VHN82_08790, partial [Methanoregula sp.]|nr:hypothetical protein [Methanoregula sp.]